MDVLQNKCEISQVRHRIRVQSMYQWMKMSSAQNGEFEFKTDPVMKPELIRAIQQIIHTIYQILAGRRLNKGLLQLGSSMIRSKNMTIRSILKPAKEVPITWWSSNNPMDTRPRISTLHPVHRVVDFRNRYNTNCSRNRKYPLDSPRRRNCEMMGGSIGQATLLVSLPFYSLIPLKEKPESVQY